MPPIDPLKSRLHQGRSPLISASRRRFLQLSTAAMSGAVLSNCARNVADVSSSASPSASASGSPAAGGTLNVYSWSTYIDDDLLKNFEQKTGIKVVADIYDSNETMLAKLQAGGGSAYSVIYPSDYMVTQMVELNLLTPLDKARLPKAETLIDQWKSPAYDPNNEHSFPYAWGTTGLVYNSEVLNPGPTDWSYLWEEKAKLSRKMTLLNDVREVFGAVLKSLGYSNSTTKPEEIKAAYDKLVELKPAINSFITDGWRDQIVVGDLVLAHAYSIDGIDVRTSNPKLKYVIPKSGATVWTDTVVIPKNAPNVEAAYAWLNYVLEPETAGPITSRLKLATPNKEVLNLLPAELKEDPSLFPPDDVLSKCEVLAPIGKAVDIYDRYWTELTSA